MKKLFYTLVILALVGSTSAQWVQLTNGIGNNTLITSFSVTGSNIFAGTENGVYLSGNNGNSWSSTNFINHSIYSLATNGYMIFAGTYVQGVFFTANNGNNWTQTSLGNGNDVHSLAISGINIFAGSGIRLYKSTNLGNSWTTSLNYPDVMSIFIKDSTVFAGASNALFISTNNGATWLQNYSINNQSFRSFAAIGNNIFAATTPSGVYLSTNNGTNWSQTALSNVPVNCLTAIGNNIFAGTNSNGIYQSTNNGVNWIQVNQGFSAIPSIQSLIIANNYIFAGTSSSVWRRPLSEITETQNINTEIPLTYSLSQNYPNPFNPTTNIKFSIPKAEVVKIIIYDISGKELEILVNETLQAGTFQTKWDASSYSTGLYFYKITAGKFFKTKQMILTK